jgi:L-threonine-O-3-phosphate decarboxylase
MKAEPSLTRPLHGGNLAWAAALAQYPHEQIIDFSASINPLGPPQSAIAAIQTHLKDLKAYPDPAYRSLRETLSQFHQVPLEWILPGNGAAELLIWACRELAEQEVTYLITPAFGVYWRALKSFNASTVTCPFDLSKLLQPTSGSLEQLLEVEARPEWFLGRQLSQVTGPTSQGLLLNNPHNPTGQLFLKETLLPYLERFALVVIDEAYMDFLPLEQDQSLLAVVQDYPNLVIVRSLTKFYGLPSLRLGYAIAHPQRLQRWQQWRDPWPVNGLAVAAAQAVLQDKAFQQQTWAWLPVARQHLFQGLAQLPGLQPYPSATNFLLVKSEQSSSQLQEKLLKHSQILIRDCLSFPELGDRYFRVAVRSKADNQRLLEGLAQVL